MTTFLTIRVLHVVAAALWLGGAALAAYFLLPALRDLGPDAGKTVAALQRRRFLSYIPATAGVTVVTGFWLYWRFTAGFDPVMSRSSAGMMFGVGGILGLVTAALGDLLVARRMRGAVALATQAAAMPDGAEKTALLQTAGLLRAAAGGAAKLIVLFILAVMVLMTLGHYV